jgi:uncharacterized protein (DUF2342 family)
VQEGLGDANLPIVASRRHQDALSRVQAFAAMFEGYANQACTQVAGEIIDEPNRIDEVMARRGVSTTEGEELLTGLLGLSFDRSLEQSGTTFCAAVVSLRGHFSIVCGSRPITCLLWKRSRIHLSGWNGSSRRRVSR